MKKIVLIILAALLTQFVSAQNYGNKRFTLSVSPTVSWMKSDHDRVGKASSTAGYNFGVFMDNFFGDNYAFTTGLTINTTGGRLNYPATETSLAYKETYK